MRAGASYMFEYIRLVHRDDVSDSDRRFTGSRGSRYAAIEVELFKLFKRFAIVEGFVVDYGSALQIACTTTTHC